MRVSKEFPRIIMSTRLFDKCYVRYTRKFKLKFAEEL